MQFNTIIDCTVILFIIWTELDTPQFCGEMRGLEAYDRHQLTLLGLLTMDFEWNRCKYKQQKVAVVQSDQELGLLGRDRLPQESTETVCDESQKKQGSRETHTGITANAAQGQEDTSILLKQVH